MEEHRLFPPNFEIKAYYKKYSAGDTRPEDNLDNRDRVVSSMQLVLICLQAKIWVDLRDLGLAPLQRERFIFLLGPRYKNSHIVKLVCKQYNTFHENYMRVMEILREIYWESLRAPTT